MDIPLSTLNSLLSETFQLAEEAEVTQDKETFVSFVRDNIPFEYLDYLENERNVSLEDIWTEKYEPIPNEEIDDGSCLICEREIHLTRHHLIPRELHHQVMKKKGYSQEFLNQTISICRMCHSTVHRFYTNRELADTYNTLDALMAQEKILKYASWASSQGGRGNRRTK
jgi:5-methylcytosine-specific restriction endonuclease McrA